MNSAGAFPFPKWILFNTLGWLLGIALGIFFSSLFESIHVQGQFPLAIGVAMGVGFMQWLLLRKYTSITLLWMWLLVTGFTLPFILFDYLPFFSNWKPESYIVIAVAIGAFLGGLLQYRFCLARTDARSTRWILFSLAGWLIATAFVFLVFRNIRGLPRLLAVFIAFANLIAGGPILGWITGKYITKAITVK
jgi:hypothetical protein